MKNTILFLLAFLPILTFAQPTQIIAGGQSIGANWNIGPNDAFRFGIGTNGTARLYFGSSGRVFSNTITDFIVSPSDSAKAMGGAIGIFGAPNNYLKTEESGNVVTVVSNNGDAMVINGGTNTDWTGTEFRLKSPSGGAAPNVSFREADGNGTSEIDLKAPESLSASFTQTLTAATGIIPACLNGSATLDFADTAAGTSTDLTVTVTGAADGDLVSIGISNGSTVANGCFTGWVSATNTVTIRFANNSLVASLDPASGTFKAQVCKQ